MVDLADIDAPKDEPQNAGDSLAACVSDRATIRSATAELREALRGSDTSSLAAAVAQIGSTGAWASAVETATNACDAGASATAFSARQVYSALAASSLAEGRRAAAECGVSASAAVTDVDGYNWTLRELAAATHASDPKLPLGVDTVHWMRSAFASRGTQAALRGAEVSVSRTFTDWAVCKELLAHSEGEPPRYISDLRYFDFSAVDRSNLIRQIEPVRYGNSWTVASVASYAANLAEQLKAERTRLEMARVDRLLKDLSADAQPFWNAVRDSGTAAHIFNLPPARPAWSPYEDVQVSRKRRTYIISVLRTQFGKPNSDFDLRAIKAALTDLLVRNGYVRQTFKRPSRPRAIRLVHDQVRGHQLNTGVPPPQPAKIHSLNPAVGERPSVQKEQDHGRLYRPARGRSSCALLLNPPAVGLRAGSPGHPPAAGQPYLGRRPRLHPGHGVAGRPLYRAGLGQVGRVVRLARRHGPARLGASESLAHG